MANTRNIALNVLLKIENEGAYSNIASVSYTHLRAHET